MSSDPAPAPGPSLLVRHGRASEVSDPEQALRDGADMVWTPLSEPSREILDKLKGHSARTGAARH